MAIASNPGVPHIPSVVADVNALASVANRLKEGVEAMGGHRGTGYDKAVTLQDLITLGLTTKQNIVALLSDP